MTSNMYLKFEMPSIVGASQVPGHKGEIEVLSWSNSFVQPTSPSRGQPDTGTVEQAKHSNFTFTKYADSSTNDLLKLCWSGKMIMKATLTCCRVDGTDDKPVEYLAVVMEHVLIMNYSILGGPGDVPVEKMELDYGIIEYRYKPQKQGSASNKVLSAKHNLETGTIE